MIQHQLIREGRVLAVRALPHTAVMAQLEITKIEYGIVHFSYRRNDDPSEVKHLTMGKADCEAFVVKGMWTDIGEVKSLPEMNESQLDGLADEDNIGKALDDAATHLTWWLERFDNDQVRGAVHASLDTAIDQRLAEMRGHARAGT